MLQIIIKVAPILIPSRFIYACSMPAPALYTLFSSVIWCIVISIFLPRPWPRLLSAPASISLNYDPRRPAAGDLILILIGFLWIEMWSRIIPAALPSYYTTIFYLYVISVLWHPRNLWVEELQSQRINILTYFGTEHWLYPLTCTVDNFIFRTPQMNTFIHAMPWML